MQPIQMSLDQARRAAVAAQGLHRPRTDGPRTMRHVQGVIDRLGLFQIDSVNVLARAHLLPLFSRLGPYDTDLLDRATVSGGHARRSTRGAAADRRLVESWAHVAAYVPPHVWPLLAFRRRWFAEEYDWRELDGVRLPDAPQVREVHDLVASEGPLSASQIHDRFVSEGRSVRRKRGTWWDWSTEKRVVEHLFFTGEVVSAGRNAQFERLYDLPERVLPPSALVEVPELEAKKTLLELGARAQGIGDARSIKDYYRLKGPVADRALAELAEDGVLLPARVAGGSEKWFLHRDAARPRRAAGQALLAPFDPLVWERTRLERLFGMRYRIGIYTPAAQRTDGYYVLPFLEDSQLTARVDLKADRAAGVLRVQSAHAEPTLTDHTPARLAHELHAMARWLGLEGVTVEDKGTLSPALRAAAAVS
ncbi:winged helix-turn-helix domain-containing protein [Promicromonospora sp. NPDC090134]|uniref:winged helix-turn-helix domain-containing protein n=1 Tax=Promicromonospora sp. NPDC090134 TaxID=3364408 RepID=UPI00380BB315